MIFFFHLWIRPVVRCSFIKFYFINRPPQQQKNIQKIPMRSCSWAKAKQETCCITPSTDWLRGTSSPACFRLPQHSVFSKQKLHKTLTSHAHTCSAAGSRYTRRSAPGAFAIPITRDRRDGSDEPNTYLKLKKQASFGCRRAMRVARCTYFVAGNHKSNIDGITTPNYRKLHTSYMVYAGVPAVHTPTPKRSARSDASVCICMVIVSVPRISSTPAFVVVVVVVGMRKTTRKKVKVKLWYFIGLY